MEPFKEYLHLRDELDSRCAELYALHAPHLNCREGCDLCCMDFGILPVEYDAIRARAGESLQKGSVPPVQGGCPFLVNHSCAIYHERPMICRTQGLPLLFMGEENWELSACELNFTQFDFDNFTPENTFPQDQFNSRLFMLNKKYIESLPEKPYMPTELIPLRKLFAASDKQG